MARAETIGFSIRRLRAEDVEPISQAFGEIGWNKPASQYESHFAEQERDLRAVLVAHASGRFAGYLTLLWSSEYPPFHADTIPEIQDLNVLPHLRRRGFGSALMDAAEHEASLRSSIVGIGVGLSADYGAAQQMYVQRGYVPDGRGVVHDNRVLSVGDLVPLDHSLVLHLTKSLGSYNIR